MNTTFKKINLLEWLCAGLFLFVAVPASAATQWHPVARVNGVKVAIDEKSKRYDRGTPLDKEGDRHKVNVLYSYGSPQRDRFGNRFYSETFVDEIHCSTRTVTTLSTTRYALPGAQGAVVYAYKLRTLLPQPIGPGTVNERIMETFVCDK